MTLHQEYKVQMTAKRLEMQQEIADLQKELTTEVATIEKQSSIENSSHTQVKSVTQRVTEAEFELKQIVQIRTTEESEFKSSEAELVKVLGAVNRAIVILRTEMRKGSFVQLQGSEGLIRALEVMVDALSFDVKDAQMLTALVQRSNIKEDEASAAHDGYTSLPSDTEYSVKVDPFVDSKPPKLVELSVNRRRPPEYGQPVVYRHRSLGIIDTLVQLRECAEKNLEEIRTEERSAIMKFQHLSLSLKHSIKVETETATTYKQTETESHVKVVKTLLNKEAKTTALNSVTKKLEELNVEVQQEAEMHQVKIVNMKEELHILRKVMGILVRETKGGQNIKYKSITAMPEAGFLQLSSESSNQLNEVLHDVQSLARQSPSTRLVQFAERISQTMRGNFAEDKFKMIKEMIEKMIVQLGEESEKDATHKQYCDKEMLKTEAEFVEKGHRKRKLRSEIQATSVEITQKREEIKTLRSELVTIEEQQKRAVDLRKEQEETYKKNVPEIETSLEGVRNAVRIMTKYYALEESDFKHQRKGHVKSIMNFLEILEADFAKLLTETKNAEETQKDAFKQTARSYSVTKASNTQTLNQLTEEIRSTLSSKKDLKSDFSSLREEFRAVRKYRQTLAKNCRPKGQSFERRERENQETIEGLKNALKMLE